MAPCRGLTSPRSRGLEHRSRSWMRYHINISKTNRLGAESRSVTAPLRVFASIRCVFYFLMETIRTPREGGH